MCFFHLHELFLVGTTPAFLRTLALSSVADLFYRVIGLVQGYTHEPTGEVPVCVSAIDLRITLHRIKWIKTTGPTNIPPRSTM